MKPAVLWGVVAGLLLAAGVVWLSWWSFQGPPAAAVAECMDSADRRISIFSSLINGSDGALPSCVLEYPVQWCEGIASKAVDKCSGDALCVALASRDAAACSSSGIAVDQQGVCRAVLAGESLSETGCRAAVSLKGACETVDSGAGFSVVCKV